MGNDMNADWMASLEMIFFGLNLFVVAMILFYMAKHSRDNAGEAGSIDSSCSGVGYESIAIVMLMFSGLSVLVGTATLIYLSLQFNGIISPPEPEPKSVRVWVREQPDGTWAMDLSEDQLKYMRGENK